MSVLPWLLIAFVFIAAYPWSAWLLTRDAHDDGPWLPLLLALALSTGVLTLVMFWQALTGMRLALWGITLPYVVLMLPGWWLWWRSGHKLWSLPRPQHRVMWLATGLLVLIGGGVVFNSVYWPFSRADALAIYARFGLYMAENHSLASLPGDLTVHEAYPILIPLTYTYAYLSAGWINEFLARLYPALLSLGCLGTAYTLGYMLRGSLAGWLSALILALTPTFASWASSGYVDLPMAFYYSLSAIFAWRLWRGQHLMDAMLAGLMMGLAAMTKNAALLGVMFLSGWLLWALLRRRINWPHLLLALGVCAAVAAPWYVRNLLEANLIIPDTAWTDQASQTLETMLVLVTRPEVYSLSGVLILASIVGTLIKVIRRRFDAPGLLLLLWWTLPFFAAWWLWASYDPRFVLLFLPLLSVIAGIQLAALWGRLSERWQWRLRIPLMLIVVTLALTVAWDTVEFKDDILRNPLMTVEERYVVVLSERNPRLLRDRANAP